MVARDLNTQDWSTSDPTFPGGQGGNSGDNYYVSGGYTTTVDQDFTFNVLVIGRNSSAVESAGIVVVEAGFDLISSQPTLSNKEQFSIQIWAAGELKDSPTTPPTRDSPAGVRSNSNFPFPVIRLMKSGAVWDLAYQLIEKASVWFEVYQDIHTTFTPTDFPIGARLDIETIRNIEGGARFALQQRYLKLPRYSRRGDEGRSVEFDLSYDTETAGEVGLREQLRKAKEQDVRGALVTPHRVWTRMQVVFAGDPVESAGESLTRRTITIIFQEAAA